ncbi:hypothetical protein [Janthinobacterium sp. LB3P112]|uniref:hypothetical protein n=1 Tax=Janthinobacterium sp. LB3P112 TaxID=3424196 RepID=UPI003F26BBF6
MADVSMLSIGSIAPDQLAVEVAWRPRIGGWTVAEWRKVRQFASYFPYKRLTFG